MRIPAFFLCILLSLPAAWGQTPDVTPDFQGALVKIQTTSLLGDPLRSAEPSEETLANLKALFDT